MIAGRVCLEFGESHLMRHILAALMIGGGMLIAVVGWRFQSASPQL